MIHVHAGDIEVIFYNEAHAAVVIHIIDKGNIKLLINVPTCLYQIPKEKIFLKNHYHVHANLDI